MSADQSYKEQLLQKIASKQATVGVIGLGYVGLPLALLFEESGFPVDRPRPRDEGIGTRNAAMDPSAGAPRKQKRPSRGAGPTWKSSFSSAPIPRSDDPTMPPLGIPSGATDGIIHTMRATIDSAGRIVIPKSIRVETGIRPSTQLEVRAQDGRIEIEPAPLRVRVRKEGGLTVAEPEEPVEPLTTELVNEVLGSLRGSMRSIE
jgi:AbrB family looped-hinge helix DNA binding protein